MKVEDNSAERKKYHHFGDMLFNLTGLEHVNSYVTAPGACRGDSGGPAYTNEGGKFIVTGTFLPAFFTNFIYSVLNYSTGYMFQSQSS